MTKLLTLTLNPALDLSTETPELRPAEKLRCTLPRMDPGGGGINVARAMRLLGAAPRVLAATGGGTGQDIRRLLEREDIAVEQIGPGHTTRQSLSVTETGAGRQYRFVLPGARWTAADWIRAERQIRDACAPGDWLVISGSEPPGLPAEAVHELAVALDARRVNVLLDTSGPALAGAAALVDRTLSVLRMNREEAETVAGPLADIGAVAAFARRLAARGAARLVAVASGAEGTVVADDRDAWLAVAPKIEVISRVGAGDSFVAAFTIALARGADAPRACAEGAAAASAACLSPATDLCDPETVRDLLAETTVRPI